MAQIWASWQPFANMLTKKFCQKGHLVSRHMWSRIIFLKICIALILTQKRNKLQNNIVVYLCSNCCLKKFGLIHICDSWHTKGQFFGDEITLFEKFEGSLNIKHDNNCACLRSHLNGTRLHRWSRMYQTPKHYHVCSNEAIDKPNPFQWISWL